MLITKPIREEAICKTYHNILPTRSIVIAELGCSSGPTALNVVHELIQTIDSIQSSATEREYSPNLHFYLNDLPQNDFNTVFKSLPSFQERLKKERKGGAGQCFIYGVTGSFFGQLFESRSLHFVHSSFAVHWLSKVPEQLGRSNKGSIYISRTSPLRVLDAYYQQFRSDFSTFLRCRSEELLNGGYMVLTVLGRSEDRSSKECCYLWEPLAAALNQMVSEDLIEEEKMDLFNIPIYHPSIKEIEDEVTKEGSFTINRLEVSEVDWNAAATSPTNYNVYNYKKKTREGLEDDNSERVGLAQSGVAGVDHLVGCVRAVVEPILVDHFGETIIEELFRRYSHIAADIMAKERNCFFNVTVSLIKNLE